MRIGIVTDELSAEVGEAIRLGAGWGIVDYELRTVRAARVPAIAPAMVDELLRFKDKLGIRYTALSPGVGKGSIEDEEKLARELDETLPATFALAKRLEVPLVIVFGFQRLPQQPDTLEAAVVAALGRMAVTAAKAEVRLALENEPGFWCDTGRNTARILAAANSPLLCANWDPANAFGADEIPYPQGYEAIKKWVINVHVKDTSAGTLVECVPVGEGKIDWEGQLRALVQDRLVEHVTIETHCLPLAQNSQKNLLRLRQILQRIGVDEMQ